MSGSDELALDRLKTRIDKLEVRATRGERQRRGFFVSQMCLIAASAVLFGLTIFMLAGRSDSRAYYNTQIERLVCSVPPDTPTADRLRAPYHCPPYQPPAPTKEPAQ